LDGHERASGGQAGSQAGAQGPGILLDSAVYARSQNLSRTLLGGLRRLADARQKAGGAALILTTRPESENTDQSASESAGAWDSDDGIPPGWSLPIELGGFRAGLPVSQSR